MKIFTRVVAPVVIASQLFLSNTPVNAAPGVVASWSFDSTSGTTYYDVTGHGYDASSTGSGVGRVPGVNGQALSCPGSGYEITVANSLDSFNLPRFSLETWFYSTIAPSQMSGYGAEILDYTHIPLSGGLTNGFNFYINQSGNVVLVMSTSDGSGWRTASSTPIIQARTWYHIIGTYDGTTLRIYVNGALNGSYSYQGRINPPNANARMTCQTRTDGIARGQLNGMIDELKLYNYALPLDSVTAHYNAIPHAAPVLIPYTPNPTGNWRPLVQWHANPAISLFRIQVATDTLFSSLLASVSTTDTFYLPTADMPLGAIFWRVGNEVNPGIDFWSTRSSISILSDSVPRIFAYWSFDSTSGTTYYDVTGHGYDASSTGSGVGLVPGVKGQALNCTGGNFDVTVANSRDSFYLSKLSIETWFYSNVNPSQYTSEGKILDYQYITSGTRNGYTVDITPTGSVRFILTTADGSAWVTASTASLLIKATTWYHIVCTYDYSFLRIYVNGVLSGSLSYQGAYLRPNNNAHIGFQKRSDGSSAYFLNGKIDELKLYNYALTLDSIMAHYNAIPHAAPVLIPYTPNPTYNRRPLVRWYANPAISQFRVQIATDTAFSSLLASVPTTDTLYLPTADMPLGTIFWRVANEVNTGVDFWSTRSSICILSDSIPVLIRVTPDTQRTRRPRLSWYRVPTAPTYLLQIDLAGNFVTPYFSTTLTDTTYLMTVDLPLGTLFWRVGAIYNTTTLYSTPDTFWIVPTGIAPKTIDGNKQSTSPSFVQLRHGIALNYSLEKQSAVSLDIFSIAGNRIAAVYRGSAPAGNHSITWNGTGKGGKPLPAGSYLAVFKINERTFTKVIMLMR